MIDQEIISLFEQRNEQAISESEQQYGALCRSVARNITGSDEDAEECLNDAMLAAWNAIPPAKPKNYCAYLLRLVRNAAYNRYCAAHTLKRNAANIASSLDELAEIIPDRGDVVDEVERREIIGAITLFCKTAMCRRTTTGQRTRSDRLRSVARTGFSAIQRTEQKQAQCCIRSLPQLRQTVWIQSSI